MGWDWYKTALYGRNDGAIQESGAAVLLAYPAGPGMPAIIFAIYYKNNIARRQE
jgi:hypothetical protein